MKNWYKRQQIRYYSNLTTRLNRVYTQAYIDGNIVYAQDILKRLLYAEDRLAELQGREAHPSAGAKSGATTVYEALCVSGAYNDILPALIGIDERSGR